MIGERVSEYVRKLMGVERTEEVNTKKTNVVQMDEKGISNIERKNQLVIVKIEISPQ